jgi:hypothetical protein
MVINNEGVLPGNSTENENHCGSSCISECNLYTTSEGKKIYKCNVEDNSSKIIYTILGVASGLIILAVLTIVLRKFIKKWKQKDQENKLKQKNSNIQSCSRKSSAKNSKISHTMKIKTEFHKEREVEISKVNREIDKIILEKRINKNHESKADLSISELNIKRNDEDLSIEYEHHENNKLEIEQERNLNIPKFKPTSHDQVLILNKIIKPLSQQNTTVFQNMPTTYNSSLNLNKITPNHNDESLQMGIKNHCISHIPFKVQSIPGKIKPISIPNFHSSVLMNSMNSGNSQVQINIINNGNSKIKKQKSQIPTKDSKKTLNLNKKQLRKKAKYRRSADSDIKLNSKCDSLADLQGDDKEIIMEDIS